MKHLKFVIVIIISFLKGTKCREIIEHPKNQTAKIGEIIIQNCKFNEPVRCSWIRNNAVYQPDQYLHNKLNNSGNCSFQLKVTKLDFGTWKCTASASGHLEGISSNKTFLTEKQTIEPATPANVTQKIIIYDNEASSTNATSTTLNSQISESIISNNFIWFSVAGGLTALSILNTVIVVCCRQRKAKNKRLQKNSSLESSEAVSSRSTDGVIDDSSVPVNTKMISIRYIPTSISHNEMMRNSESIPLQASATDDEYLQPFVSVQYPSRIDTFLPIPNSGHEKPTSFIREDIVKHVYQNTNSISGHPIYEEIVTPRI